MAPTRSAHLTSIAFYGLLCFVIVMQMLGATASFWTLEFESDLVRTSFLEGLSLIPPPITLLAVLHAVPYQDTVPPLPSTLLENMFFRPPSVPSSALSLV
jgi:hypothetical protein